MQWLGVQIAVKMNGFIYCVCISSILHQVVALRGMARIFPWEEGGGVNDCLREMST